MRFLSSSAQIACAITTLVSTSLAAPLLLQPNAQDIINDIRNIDTGVRSLITHLNGIQSNSLPTLVVNGVPVLADVAAIHISNRKGYGDALAAPQLSPSDSSKVVDAVQTTVAKSIPSSISILKDKKPIFQKAAFSPVIVASLKLLLNDHDTFSAAVLQKLTLDAAGKKRANEGITLIHDAIVGGINYYQK